MRTSFFTPTLLACFFFLSVRGIVTPTSPAPGVVFTEGANCTITWTGDFASTEWKEMNIQLMTGNNFNMTHLTTVATKENGNINGTFTYKCPKVTVHSLIYFYQFSTPLAPKNLTWTGRFGIVQKNGKLFPPKNATQPGTNETIPWGEGALRNTSTAVNAPSYLLAATVSNTSSVATTTPSATGAPFTGSATMLGSRVGSTALLGSLAIVFAILL